MQCGTAARTARYTAAKPVFCSLRRSLPLARRQLTQTPRSWAIAPARGETKRRVFCGAIINSRLWRHVHRPGVGAERFARRRIEIKHVAAAVEFQFGALLAVEGGKVLEHIAGHRVGRDHVAIAVRDHEPE